MSVKLSPTTPPAQPFRTLAATAATYRRGIDGAISRIRERAEHLSDEQRDQLRALADSQAET